MAFFAGFDSKNYPGIETLYWLSANSILKWCGYYLAPAPNRSPSGWPGQYASVKAQWGVLPVYVGQQDPNTATGNYVPSSILTTAQGTIDGKNAADLAAGDQFPPGTFVYLDWEQGDLNSAGAADYIKAWVAAVMVDGRVMPAIYCSHAVAQGIAALMDQLNPTPIVRFWCWKVSNPTDAHPYTGDLNTGDLNGVPTPDPSGCGFAADAWQREANAVFSFPNDAPLTSLQVDLSTATLADPGAPLVTTA